MKGRGRREGERVSAPPPDGAQSADPAATRSDELMNEARARKCFRVRKKKGQSQPSRDSVRRRGRSRSSSAACTDLPPSTVDDQDFRPPELRKRERERERERNLSHETTVAAGVVWANGSPLGVAYHAQVEATRRVFAHLLVTLT